MGDTEEAEWGNSNLPLQLFHKPKNHFKIEKLLNIVAVVENFKKCFNIYTGKNFTRKFCDRAHI